jgi:hypothetical protein
MNSAASRQVVMPADAADRQAAVSGLRAISATMLSAIGFTAGPQ